MIFIFQVITCSFEGKTRHDTVVVWGFPRDFQTISMEFRRAKFTTTTKAVCIMN